MNEISLASNLRHQFLVGTIGTIAKNHGPWLAVISSDDNYLSHSGGSARDLWKSAGLEALSASVADSVPLPVQVGSVVETVAGELPAKALLHAITLDFDTRISVSIENVHSFFRNLCEAILALLRKHPNAPRRILLPLLGTGTAGMPMSVILVAVSRLAIRLGFSGVQITVAALEDCPALEEKFRNIEIWTPDAGHYDSDEEARVNSIILRIGDLLRCCANFLKVGFGDEDTNQSLWAQICETLQKKGLRIPSELETTVEQAMLAQKHFVHRQVSIEGELLESLYLGVEALVVFANDYLSQVGGVDPKRIRLLTKQVRGGAFEKSPKGKSVSAEKGLPALTNTGLTCDPASGGHRAANFTVSQSETGAHVHKHEMQHVDNLVALLSTLPGPEAKELELLLDELQYRGARLFRLKEYCARMDPMEILRRLGAAQLRRILHEKYNPDSKPKLNSKTDELAALILNHLGFPVQEPVEGISFAYRQVIAIRSRLPVSGHHERAGLVIEASSYLESSIRNLLRFICLQVYKRGPEKELYPKLFPSDFKDRKLDSLSLGHLLDLLNTLAKDLDSAPPEKRGYLDAPLTARRLAPKGFDSITSLRNIFAHDRLRDNSENDLSGKAAEFLDQTLQLLEFWNKDWDESPPIYPKIIRVETITIDSWNRRVIRAITADGVIEHIVTGMPVRAGGTYFMFPLSNPFRIDPLLIEFSYSDPS